MRRLDLEWIARSTRGRDLHLFLDFDGTLAAHRADGGRSVPYRGIIGELSALSRAGTDRVSIVSGRPVAELKQKLGLKELYYAGNHGLDIRGPGEAFLHPRAAAARKAIGAAARLIRSRTRRVKGVVVDQNGLSLSVNFGLVAPLLRLRIRPAIDGLRRETAALGLRWQEGYLGWDLIFKLGWDKGDAVSRLMRLTRKSLAVAIGDGASDEPMFRAVGAGGISIRVGRARGSNARFWVRGVPEVARILSLLRSRSSR